jgi:hypothetical protein
VVKKRGKGEVLVVNELVLFYELDVPLQEEPTAELRQTSYYNFLER